jgi:hypothetical protein
MKETQLKMQHAAAIRSEDTAEIKRVEKELAKMGIVGEWLSDTVLVWRTPPKKRRTPKSAPK